MLDLLKKNKPLLGGHRGCNCQYRENSLQAMQEAIRQGAAYLEIDLQMTKDEIIVIYHDLKLENKTVLNGYVQNYTYAELKREVAELATLEEVFSWASENNIYLALELKEVILDMHDREYLLIDKLIKLLREYSLVSNVFVFGLDYQILAYLKKHLNEVAIGLIVPQLEKDPVKLMKDNNALIYLTYLNNLTEKTIQDLQANGYYVDASVINDVNTLHRAKQLGIDMLESDEVALIKTNLNSWQNY